jgi:hypothetical protein
MTALVCPRCASVNGPWEKRCTSCWLPFEEALRRQGEAAERPRVEDPIIVVPEGERLRTHTAAKPPLAELLGIEAEHAWALAEAGIHTLEHVAQAAPAEIGLALRAWTHIDAGALIALARRLLQKGKSGAADPAPNPLPDWLKNV